MLARSLERPGVERRAAGADCRDEAACEVVGGEGVMGALRPPRGATCRLGLAVALEGCGEGEVQAPPFAREEPAVHGLLDERVAKAERAGRLVVDRHDVPFDGPAALASTRAGQSAPSTSASSAGTTGCAATEIASTTSLVRSSSLASRPRQHGAQPGRHAAALADAPTPSSSST